MAGFSIESAGPRDELIGLIYEAAVDTDRWLDVARALSEALDRRPVTIWLRLPESDSRSEIYRWPAVDLPPQIFAKHFHRGLPWGNQAADAGPSNESTRRFVRFDYPSERLAATDYYKEWMAPQGFAPVSPVAHTVAVDGHTPTAAICVYQRIDGGPVGPAHVAFLDGLVPHFARAHRILDQVRAMRREHEVLREVIDRIPTGIVLLDETGHVAALNDSALLSIENREGIQIEDGRLVLDDPEMNRWLEDVVDAARDPKLRAQIGPERPMNGHCSTTNGRIPLVVTPLLSPESMSTRPDTVAMVFVGSPKLAHGTSTHLLRNLYGLTRAEAEITQLLADGLSLEEAAVQRSVTLNTARSQLKRVFAKTGAKRQADLVRIVIGGVASVRGERRAS